MLALSVEARITMATNGVEPIGVSMPARARGGADVAVGDTPLAQIDNPATLTGFDSFTFDFSGQFAMPDAWWSSPIDSSESQVKFVPLGNAAVALPVSDRLTFGLALHSKAGLASRYSMRHLMIPYMDRRVGADSKMVGVYFNAAYRLNDRLSVGAGVRAEATTSEFSLVLGPADIDFGRGYALGGGFQLGLHYQAFDNLSFGLGYRSPTWSGDVSGGEGQASLFGFLPIDLGAVQIENLRLPQRIALGTAWDATERLKIVGEVRWLNYDYSSLDSLVVQSQRPIEARVELPLEYRDQWVFIVGAEYRLDDHWTASLGYNYGTQPVSRAGLAPMGSTIAEHHVTAGLRYARDNWWIGGGYIAGLAPSLRNDGRSSLPWGVDYSGSSLDQIQHSVLLGFGFSFGPNHEGGRE